MEYIYKAFHTYHYLSLKIDYGFKDNEYSLFQNNEVSKLLNSNSIQIQTGEEHGIRPTKGEG